MSALDWACTPERRALTESIHQICRSESALTALNGAGIPWIGLEESLGGTGGDLADAAAAVRALALIAYPVPIAETALVAGWALEQSGIQIPTTLLAPAFSLESQVHLDRANSNDTLSGSLHNIAGINAAEYIVIPVDSWLCLVHKNDVTVKMSANVAHEDRGTVIFDSSAVQALKKLPSRISPIDLFARLAFARAIQLSGALIAVRDLSINFAKTREQFGKPIASLQIVSHYLAQLAELALVGEGAIATALAAPTTMNFAIAKSVTGRAAREASRVSHQVHGAMGMSEEYPLGQFTTRMWSWTEEAGRPEFWNTYIGQAFLKQPNRDLWVSITDGIEGEHA